MHTPSSFSLKDSAISEIYSLSLHDALPIYPTGGRRGVAEVADLALVYEVAQRAECLLDVGRGVEETLGALSDLVDRKSTRLNSSHLDISYAVLCLIKKKNTSQPTPPPTHIH